jgi:hypothetical protein
MSGSWSGAAAAGPSSTGGGGVIDESVLIKELLLYRGMVRTAMVFSDELRTSAHLRGTGGNNSEAPAQSKSSTSNSISGSGNPASGNTSGINLSSSSAAAFLADASAGDPRGTLAGATPHSLVEMFRKFLRKPDLDAAINLWDMFEDIFLSRADSPSHLFYRKAVELRLSLYKLFLVSASKISANSPEIIRAFYARLKFGVRIGRGMQDSSALFGGSLNSAMSSGGEFYDINEKEMEVAKRLPALTRLEPPILGSEWLTLPYIGEPARHPFFEPYFSKDWEELFFVSLFNFFEKVFAACPLPRLLSFGLSRCEISSLRTQVKCLQDEVQLLRSKLSDAACRLPLEINNGVVKRSDYAVHNLTLFESSRSAHRVATSDAPEYKADSRNHSELIEVGVHMDRIIALKLSPDNRFFCTASKDAVLRIWDIDTLLHQATLGASELIWNSSHQTCLLDSPINCCEWVPNLKYNAILLGTEDCKIRLWNCDTRTIDQEKNPKKSGPEMDMFGSGSVVAIACHPRAPLFAVSVAADFKNIRLRSGNSTPSVSYSDIEPDSGAVSVWSLVSWEWKHHLPLSDENLTACTALRYNSTGSMLVMGLLNGAIQLVGKLDVFFNDCT